MNFSSLESTAAGLDGTAAMGLVGVPGAAGSGAADGGAFAAQLGQALGQLTSGQVQGQGFAAGLPGLQATVLSPGWQVLTPSQNTMDHQALAEFAKAQGIDEAAVQWLFQQNPATVSAVSPEVALNGVTSINGLTQAEGLPVDVNVSVPGEGGPGSGMGVVIQATAAQVLGHDALAKAGHSGTLTRPIDGDVSKPVESPNVAPPSDPGAIVAIPELSETGDVTPEGVAMDEVSAAALVPMALWAAERMAPAQQTERPTAVTAAQTDPEFGLPQVNKALRSALAAAVQKAMASPETQTGKKEPHVDVLELDAELQADLRNWLDDGSMEPVELPGERTSTSSHGGAFSAPAAGATRSEANPALAAQASNAAERAESLQALANRVSNALGQRMVSMIERGHWNVKFMLKPQHLGEIEVDLRMRSGELDASFRATNGFTRDLLQDGLPRLREVMSNMGMDVASMHVGNGQSQKNGGNPTQQFKSPKGGESVSKVAAGAESVSAPKASRQSSDGLDVMV